MPPACARPEPDLTGPAHGVVELPLRLFWSAPHRTFDLDQPPALLALYETVLQEASRPDDLTSYLNGETLVAVWPDLHGVRPRPLPGRRARRQGRGAGRAVERDCIDVAAALARGYSVEQLTGLALALDPGLTAEDFADAGQRLDRSGDDRFARYGLTPEDVTRLREQCAAWRRSPGAVPWAYPR